MNPELNSGQHAQESVAQAHAHPQSQPLNNTNSLVEFSDHPSFNFGLAITCIVALISILATLYLWWMNKNLSDKLSDELVKKNNIVAQLNSPSIKDVEQKAQNFKDSVSALSRAEKSRFSMYTFLPEMYSKLTDDVQISSLSVDQNNKLNIAGHTKNYRSTADLMVALKSWNVLEDVDLVSVAMSETDNTAQFTITSMINVDNFTSENATTTESSTLNQTTGSSNEAQ